MTCAWSGALIVYGFAATNAWSKFLSTFTQLIGEDIL